MVVFVIHVTDNRADKLPLWIAERKEKQGMCSEIIVFLTVWCVSISLLLMCNGHYIMFDYILLLVLSNHCLFKSHCSFQAIGLEYIERSHFIKSVTPSQFLCVNMVKEDCSYLFHFEFTIIVLF